MTLNRLLTFGFYIYTHTCTYIHIQNDLEQAINLCKIYIFSKSTCKLERKQNGGVHTVVLKSNYHSRSYCDSHHVNYLSLKGGYIFSRLPMQLGQSGRYVVLSGLTGLIIPLLIMYTVSKSHKGTYKFKNENSFFQDVLLLEAESEPLVLLH